MKTLLLYILVLFCSFNTIAQTVNVTDPAYGATPNNSSDDDYSAIANAIAACQSLTNPVLVLPEGTYHITSENSGTPYFPIDGIDNLTIQGQGAGAKIEFSGFNYNRHVFKFTNCKNLSVENLKIDYTEPPFTQGQIIQSGGGWMDIKVQLGFHDIEPANKPQIKGYAVYDNILEQQISGVNEAVGIGNGWYWEDKANRVMRIGYNNNGYSDGDYILLRHTLYDGYSFIVSNGCENVTLKDITVHIAPGYPFYAEKGPKNISFINCRIEKKPGLWMTSTVDGAHLLDAKGDIIFENCLFENMGDDGINLHGYFLYIFQKQTSKRLVVGNTDKGWYDDAGWKVGDKCEFFNGNKQSVGFATIDIIERLHYSGNNNQMRLTFKENIPDLPGNLWEYSISNVSLVGKLTVKGTTIRDNRSRGILVSSSDVIIENSTFERNPFPAIKFEVSNSWQESTPARNVIIRNNIFDDTNFVPVTNYPGVISFKINKSTTANACDVFKNIRITGNTIQNSSTPFVSAKHVKNLEVADNTFQNTTGDGNLIQFGESQNQVFSNNSGATEDDLGTNCTTSTETPSVVLDLKTLSFTQIETYRLSATVTPFTASIVWDSNDDSVATIDSDGIVTVTGPGVATITATINEGGTNYSDSCEVTVDSNQNTLSINENDNLSTILVYPNPVKNILNIHLDTNYQNATAEIVDLSGRLILNKNLNDNDNMISLSELSNGIYILRLKSNKKTVSTHKILKQ